MFAPIDWIIILAYLAFAALTGIYLSKRSSGSLSSYFVAGRSLPWWWLGTSMVATTFAADTPLAVTGIVATKGISGNWIWWNWGIILSVITVFFSRHWVKSGVLTDVEFTELRYDRESASFLRLFKAIFSGLILNLLILGWVFKAMTKIIEPFIQWKAILGISLYQSFEAAWPGFLLFGSLDNSLSVFSLLALVVFYSSLGGIRAVILTDLIQFLLAIGGAIIFAWLAVDKLGGMHSLQAQVKALYPGNYHRYLDFFPGFNSFTPVSFFLVYLGIQWYTKEFSDGSGYFAQRINTARSEDDAEKGMLWFSIAHISLRSWPWIIIGLTSLVFFPIGNEQALFSFGDKVAADRELAYPFLMREILPPGILGLVFASLMAAFMSTVDTHLNWGASYLVNDVLKRFVLREALEKTLLRFSRAFIVILAASALIVAANLDSIIGAWKLFFSLAAGVGLPQLLRWFWRRANAFTEISSMFSALLVTIVLSFFDLEAEYNMAITAFTSVIISIATTLLTKPVGENHYQVFLEKTGFRPGKVLTNLKLAFVVMTLVYCLLFSIGSFLLRPVWQGFLYLAIAIIAGLYYRKARLQVRG